MKVFGAFGQVKSIQQLSFQDDESGSGRIEDTFLYQLSQQPVRRPPNS